MIRRVHGMVVCALLAAAMTGPAWAANGEAGAPASQPDRNAEDDVSKPVNAEDKPKVLREAIEQWRNKEYRKAGINLTRLINSSKKDELETLSAEAEKETQMPLAELAAETHFENAKEQSKTGMIRLQYVTSYENEPLVKRIDEAYKKAIEEPFTPPPTTRPERKTTRGEPREEGREGDALRNVDRRLHRNEPGKAENEREPAPAESAGGTGGAAIATGLKISEFMSNPKAFANRDHRPDECAAFARHVSYAISLLDARLRLDATLRTNKEEKTKLLTDKKNLEELRRTVITTAHMTPAQRERAERMRKMQEEKKQRQEQQRQPRQRSQSSGRGNELERVIKRSTAGYGVQ
ncbi:MAG: hypothetical protein ACPMAQ_08745 [Phycisphaerae bacterium]